jgi:two-component system response regulator YesN
MVNDSGRGTDSGDSRHGADLLEALSLDPPELEPYLRSGLAAEYDEFFEKQLQPIAEAALHSTLIKHYLFVDVMLTSAQFVSDMGGRGVEVVPEMMDIERFLVNIKTRDQINEALRRIITEVLVFRDGRTQFEKTRLVYQAKQFIDSNFTDPDLLLKEVAASVNLSPSHFSVVFGHEIGESFKDYLTRIRIERARELLRTTNLTCSEIALRSGYSDPHYFSYVFKKFTGVPPQRFRRLSQV